MSAIKEWLWNKNVIVKTIYRYYRSIGLAFFSGRVHTVSVMA